MKLTHIFKQKKSSCNNIYDFLKKKPRGQFQIRVINLDLDQAKLYPLSDGFRYGSETLVRLCNQNRSFGAVHYTVKKISLENDNLFYIQYFKSN